MSVGDHQGAPPTRPESIGMPQVRVLTAAAKFVARTLARPEPMRGLVCEAAWVTAHLAIYPIGFFDSRAPRRDLRSMDSLPPMRRGRMVADIEAAGTPILLIPGLVDNRSIFTLLRGNLHRRGFGVVHNYCYGVLTADLRIAAEKLKERVDTLVTLGTPHEGTYAAHLAPLAITRQLRPHSGVLEELAEPTRGLKTRIGSIYSDIDELIHPASAARVTHPDIHARNVLVRGVGHMSLTNNRRIVEEVVASLVHLPLARRQVDAS